MIFKKKCDLCNNTVSKKESFTVEMKSLEGISKMIICEDCANILESMRLLKDGKILKDQDDTKEEDSI